MGHTTKYQYNNLDQPTQITDPLQGITTLSYDLNGNLKTVQDARQQGTSNKTVYSYDNFDHLQTRTDPLTRLETYVFDQLGNLTSFTDRRNKVTTYQYDGINRRTFAGYGTLPGPTYESTINYTYDGGDRRKTVVDSTSGTITPVFDGLDRLTSETTPQGSVTYTYDNDSHLKTATVTGQPIVNYYYDNASRLYQVTQGTTNTLIGYDNANRRNSLTLPNGIVLTYGYDNDSRINSMSYQLGASSVGSLTYQYDAAGRRTQMGGSLAATGFPQAVSSAAYDVANELTNWNGTTIGYDANGNIQNDGVAAYTWNGRNQLISRGSTSFQYDSYGRRNLNAAGNKLLYEGSNAGQELSGTTPVANRILGGIDEFFNRTESSGVSSPITDALGSILALTNSSGNAHASMYGRRGLLQLLGRVMTSNADVAKQISELMLDIFRRLDESIDMVKAACPPEEAAAYQKKIGRVVGPIVMDVLDPLYEKNPTLKPANWEEWPQQWYRPRVTHRLVDRSPFSVTVPQFQG